jgi:hypothetical protein
MRISTWSAFLALSLVSAKQILVKPAAQKINYGSGFFMLAPLSLPLLFWPGPTFSLYCSSLGEWIESFSAVKPDVCNPTPVLLVNDCLVGRTRLRVVEADEPHVLPCGRAAYCGKLSNIKGQSSDVKGSSKTRVNSFFMKASFFTIVAL